MLSIICSKFPESHQRYASGSVKSTKIKTRSAKAIPSLSLRPGCRRHASIPGGAVLSGAGKRIGVLHYPIFPAI